MAADGQSGSTDVEEEEFTYRWKIESVRPLRQKTEECLKSPIFSMGKDNIQWILELYPVGSNNNGSDFHGAIWLRLVSRGSAPLNITVRCKISALYARRTDTVGEIMWFCVSSSEFQHTFLIGKTDGSDCIGICQRFTGCNDRLFVVECKLVRSLTKLEKRENCPKFLTYNDQLVNSCRQLLQEPHQFHDVTIIVEDKEFPAHKVFLAIRSPIFAAMFTNKDWKENQTNEVRIEHTGPEVIEAMLEYIYTDEVKNLSEVAFGLIAVAHKYELQSLKTMCEEVLWKTLNNENAHEIVELANLYGSDELIVFVNEFIKNNFRKVVESAFDKIDDPVHLQRIMALIINKKKE